MVPLFEKPEASIHYSIDNKSMYRADYQCILRRVRSSWESDYFVISYGVLSNLPALMSTYSL